MKNVPNLPKVLATRTDVEVFQIFNRLLVRVMSVHPKLGYILGSREEMRSVVCQLLGEDLTEAAEDPDRETEIVRAILDDASKQRELASLMIDLLRLGTDTMLDSVTDQLALAGIMMSLLSMLDMGRHDPGVAGLKVNKPNRRSLDEVIPKTMAVLEQIHSSGE